MAGFKRILSRLYIFEKIVAIYALSAFIFTGILGANISYFVIIRPLILYGYFYYEVFAAAAIGYLMIVAYLFYRIAKSPSGDKLIGSGIAERARAAITSSVVFIRQRYFNIEFLLDFIRIIIAILVILVFFSSLGEVIPAINPKLFDEGLWGLDKTLHLGFNPTVVCLNLIKSRYILHAMEAVYKSVAFSIVFIPLVFILQFKSKLLRYQFVTAICLCLVMMTLAYYIFPAVGPCHYKAGLFNNLDAPITKKLQHILIENYLTLRQNAAAYEARNFHNITVMPNLDIAILMLFAFFAIRLNLFLGIALLLYLIAVFVSSITLGWHYAIDGYAGALVAAMAYFIATKITKQL